MSSKIKGTEQYIGVLFNKQYHELLDAERIKDLSREERREDLLTLYAAAKKLPQSFKTSILHEILLSGMKLDIYDKAHFMEYLKNPLSSSYLNEKKHKHIQYSSTWSQYIGTIQENRGDTGDLSTLYFTYLRHFYREDDKSLAGIQDQFHDSYWREWIAKI